MLSLERQDCLRNRYAQDNPFYCTSRDVYDCLLERCTFPEAVILDAGCGQAGLVERVVPNSCKVIGLDRSLVNRRSAISLRDLIQGDLAHLPFPSKTFNLISCTWVLEHLEHPRHVFKEFARILQPEGLLLLLAPNACSYMGLINRIIPNRFHGYLVSILYGREPRHIFPVYYRANTKRVLDRTLKANGFICKGFEYIGDPTYIAFNKALYRVGVLIERVTDVPMLYKLKVHFVALYQLR